MIINYDEVISRFPGTPRDEQAKILRNICNSFSNNKKFVIINVPTGVGKSHIAATLCLSTDTVDPAVESDLLSGDAFKTDKEAGFADMMESTAPHGGIVLTTTKTLQNQYEDLFIDAASLKGKNNYACDIEPDLTVDVAPCRLSSKQKDKCLCSRSCTYYNTRGAAMASSFTTLNYSVYLNLPTHLKKRELLICDEATEIEDTLVNKYTCTINYATLETENIPHTKLKTCDRHAAYAWLGELSVNIQKIYKDLSDTIHHKKKKKTPVTPTEIKRLTKLNTLVESINEVLSKYNDSEYIVEIDGQSVIYTPYNVDKLTKELFGRAERVILMSATIIDYKNFAKILGIKEEEYDYYEVESPFNPDASPIRCLSKYPLSYNTMQNMLPKVIDIAVDICEQHKNEKGVIHTHTFQINEALQQKVKSKKDRFIFRTQGITNEHIIELHTNSIKPTVVVSPSVGFGVSFDDDNGRFQIIMKAPYLPLNSKRIKMIFEKNPQHYQNKMLVHLIQMCGRCTRNINDHSTTYILDATAVKAIIREKDKLPKYFLARMV